jgi:hypothetical protein
MRIFGFDPSKHTGFALYDTARDVSAIECGVLEMPKGADHYLTGDELGLQARRLIEAYGRPDFAVIEEQSLARIGNSSADGMIYAWVSTAAIVATLANFGIPYGTLPPATWRKMFFGEHFRPPLDAKGKNNWKAAAVESCERHGIVLPARKTIAHNAAEAAALAICWRGAKLHARRYETAFLNLLQQRNVKVAA